MTLKMVVATVMDLCGMAAAIAVLALIAASLG
jgi:hypothetical protein